MKNEMGKEILWKGSFLGLALLCSSIFALSIQGQPKTVGKLMEWYPVVVLVHLAAGVILYWIHQWPVKRHEFQRGMAIVYWSMLILMLLEIFAEQIPAAARGILLADFALLAVLWIGEYVQMWRIARELNQGMGSRTVTLVEDLAEKPKDTEDFCQQIAAYCGKNNMQLEFVTREKPILVRLDGILYLAELHFYYSAYGTPVYTMEFTTREEKNRENP